MKREVLYVALTLVSGLFWIDTNDPWFAASAGFFFGAMVYS